MSTFDKLASKGIFYQPLDDGPATPDKKPSQQGDFSRGVEKSIRQIPQTAGGAIALVGDLVGSQGAIDYGLGVYENQSAKIAEITRDSDSMSNVLEDKGDANLTDWVQHNAGYVGGQLVSAAATGGLGGFIGKQLAQRGIKEVVTRGAKSAAAKEVAEKVATKGAMAGAATGLFGHNLVQEAGSIYPEAREQAHLEGRELDGGDKARVVGSALAAAGVETGMDVLMAGRLLNGARKPLMDAAGNPLRNEAGEVVYEGMARAGLREIPGGMAREAATEGIQTGIERFGAGKDLSTADAVREYVDSISVGALGGGMGGTIGAAQKQKLPESGPLTRAANAAIEQEQQQTLLLENRPDPLIVYPDGSTGTRSQFDQYLAGMPEEKRGEVEARLLGLAPQALTDEDKKQLDEREQARITRDNMQILSKREPYSLEEAYRALQTPDGKKLMIVPHATGEGYVLARPEWLDLKHQVVALDLLAQADQMEAAYQERKANHEKQEAGKAAAEEQQRAGQAAAEEKQRADQAAAAQRAAQMLETARLQRESELEAISGRVEESDRKRSQNARMDILDAVLQETAGKSPAARKRKFSVALRHVGYNSIAPTPEELAHIDRFDSIYAALEADDQIPAAPNELDVSGMIPEKKAAEPVAAPAAPANAKPAALPDNLQEAAARARSPRDFYSAAKAAGYKVQDEAVRAPLMAAFKQLKATSKLPGAGKETGTAPAQDLPVAPEAAPQAAPAGKSAEEIEAAAHQAATSPQNDLPEPTQAQKEAGNYRKGHTQVHGLDITIENPAGSVRRGVAPDGKAWENELAHHYGYIKRTTGADGDQVDAFIGPKPESDRVFIINQVDPATGRFDEHKVILGAESLEEAREIYQANYEKGWQGGKDIVETSTEGFKAWLSTGDTARPFASETGKSASKAGESASETGKSATEGAETATEPGNSALATVQTETTPAVVEPGAEWEADPVQAAWYDGANTILDADGHLAVDYFDMEARLPEAEFERLQSDNDTQGIPLSGPDIKTALDRVNAKTWANGEKDTGGHALVLNDSPDEDAERIKVQIKKPFFVEGSDHVWNMDAIAFKKVKDQGYDAIVPLDYGTLALLTPMAAIKNESTASTTEPSWIRKQIPGLTDAELAEAIEYYGPDHKRTPKLRKALEHRAAKTAPAAAAEQPAKPVPEVVAEDKPAQLANDTAPEYVDIDKDDGADIPLAFYRTVKVPHEVYIEDEGRFETVEVPASDALASVREDIENLQAMLACMKG